MGALLGIDIGTGSVKAIVVDATGETLGRGSAEYPLSHPHPGWAEQNPDDWWRGTATAVRQAMAAAGGVKIAGIGLSGQMHGAVLLDRVGRPVRPAVIWADTRSGEVAASLTAAIGRERLIEIAGSALAAGFQAATIVWLQKYEPSVWQRVCTVLLPKDEIRRRLTGELITEPSDASSTLLFDVRRRIWSETILSALGMDASLLPKVAESTAIIGGLAREAADLLGLPEGIPVAGGGADAPLAALAAGVIRVDHMALTVSTGAQVIVPTVAPRPDREGRIHAWCGLFSPSGSGAAWYQMGATMVAGLALRWLRDDIFAEHAEVAYARMNAWGESTPPGAGGLVFLPYLTGERTPHMNPHARGLLLGLTAAHGRGHLVRAVMEGATFALYDAYQVLQTLGANPETIVLSGGGAQSSLWRQIVADVFGLAVRPLRTVEQSALGAAMVAGAAIGQHDLATVAATWPRYDPIVFPNARARATYHDLLPVFRAAYRAHVADFETLARYS